MSYARFSEGDVYVYGDVRGGISCDACCLSPSTRPENLIGYERFNCATLAEMLVHLAAHRAAGHDVDEAHDSIVAEIAAAPACPAPPETPT